MREQLLTLISVLLLITGCQTPEAEERDVTFQTINLGKEVNISCFEIEPNGSMWVGLDGQGLAYKESEGTPYRFFDKLSGTLPSDVVICHYRDRQKRQWFGTFGNGMFYWDGSAFQLPDNEALKAKELEYVAAFIEDEEGTLWIATQKNGIASCDTTGQVTFFDENNSGLQTNWIADMVTFDKKTIYVASGWGLFLIDTKSKEITPLLDSNGQPFIEKQLIRSLYASSDSLLWIGTQMGLYVYHKDRHTWKQLTTDDGIADNLVKAIGRDRHGNIWITADHSITRITKESDGRYTCHAFRPDDGIGDGVFHVRAVACAPDGTMLFGSSKGCLMAKNPHASLSAQRDAADWPFIVLAILATVLLVACVLLLIRRRSHTPVYAEIEPTKMEVTPVDEQLKEKAIRLVEEHISDAEFSVEELSAALGMSRGHLYKRLVAITGKTPIEFLRTIRIKRGQQLLQSGENVSSVAWSVGMSPKQFAKYFKEEYGMLPSDYIKKI